MHDYHLSGQKLLNTVHYSFRETYGSSRNIILMTNMTNDTFNLVKNISIWEIKWITIPCNRVKMKTS